MIEGLREEAYVTALSKMMAGELVVGVFGQIPLPLLYGFQITPIPLYGIHKELIAESPHQGYCDLLLSTEGYGYTDRCPFIHSSKLFLSDDLCEKRVAWLKNLSFNKESYFLPLKNKTKEEIRIEYDLLIEKLEDLTGRYFDLELAKNASDILLKIHSTLIKLKDKDLSGREFSKFCYEIQFIFDLEDRLEFVLDYSKKYSGTTPKSILYSAPIGGVIDLFPLEKDQFLSDSLSCNPCVPLPFHDQGDFWSNLLEYYSIDKYNMQYGFKDCPYTEKYNINY